MRGNVRIYLLLLVAILAAYAPVRNFGFVNYDDPDYVTKNPEVLRGLTTPGLVWAFTSAHAANWIPLTWLSHMLDVQLFGVNSGWHHGTNVVLHACSTLLLFALLWRTTGARWRSAFVALAFALHPLHVESVAWISERKDVLSTLFWFLTLLAYLRYAERPSIPRYAPVVLLFLCGLLSKPMTVTLPLVALLLDYWPLGRLKRATAKGLVLEKVPLLALSAAVSVVTYLVQQRGGAVLSNDHIPLALRIGNALVSYVVYLAKFFWPSNLAVFYPYPSSLPMWQAVASGLALAGVTAMVLMARRRPYLAVGWLWYLITLVPVIGFVQVGVQSRADRYTYIPLVGISILIGWGAAELLDQVAWREPVLTALGTAACAAFGVLAFINVEHWRSSVTLFQHAVRVTTGNYVAHNNLGAALRQAGRIDDAIPHFESALQIKPRYPEAQSNLAEALLAKGRVDDAIPHLSEALRLQPDLAEARINFGAALMKLNRFEQAAGQYRDALQLQPESAEAHCGLGVALMEQGRLDQALPELSTAVELQPAYADAHYNLGRLLGLMGRPGEAAAEFSQTVQLQPDNAEAHFNLGTALASQQKFNDAIGEFRIAVRLRPDYANAHFNLGTALAISNRCQEASAEFSEVLRLEPSFSAARQSLDYCLSLQNRGPSAIPGARIQPRPRSNSR